MHYCLSVLGKIGLNLAIINAIKNAGGLLPPGIFVTIFVA